MSTGATTATNIWWSGALQELDLTTHSNKAFQAQWLSHKLRTSKGTKIAPLSISKKCSDRNPRFTKTLCDYTFNTTAKKPILVEWIICNGKCNCTPFGIGAKNKLYSICGMAFYIYYYANYAVEIIFCGIKSTHGDNFAPLPAKGLSFNDKRLLDALDSCGDGTRGNTSTNRALPILIAHSNGESTATRQKVRNFLVNSRSKITRNQTDLETLSNFINSNSDYIYFSDIPQDTDGVFILCLTYKPLMEIFQTLVTERFGLDAVFKYTNLRIPCYVVSGETAASTGVPGAFIITNSKKSGPLTIALKKTLELFGGTETVRQVMIDHDGVERAAIVACGQNPINCRWHDEENIQNALKNILNNDEKTEAYGYIKLIQRSKTKNMAEQMRNELLKWCDETKNIEYKTWVSAYLNEYWIEAFSDSGRNINEGIDFAEVIIRNFCPHNPGGKQMRLAQFLPKCVLSLKVYYRDLLATQSLKTPLRPHERDITDVAKITKARQIIALKGASLINEDNMSFHVISEKHAEVKYTV